MTEELAAGLVLAGAVRAGMPVLLACLGEVLAERSRVINLGVEGIMLVGALSAVVVATAADNAGLGLLGGAAAGTAMASIHALLAVTLRANQIASGLALLLTGGGLSAYLGIGYVGLKVPALPIIPVPLLAELPVFGAGLFSHDLLTYATYFLVGLLTVGLRATRPGLTLRAVGEAPASAAAAGVPVELVQWVAVLLGGALAGAGGAYLSLAHVGGWVEGMTEGRGLVAVALVIFARWTPVGAFFAALLYGLAVSVQLRLQAVGVQFSPYVLGMAPYLIVIAAMVVGRVRGAKNSMPKALVGLSSRL